MKIEYDTEKVMITNEFFNIAKISRSGQCFRIIEIEPDKYEIIAKGKRLIAIQDEAKVILLCNKSEYELVWEEYFDLNYSDQDLYSKINDLINKSEDKFLIKCSEYSKGIRILNQNPWEMLISFILSQQNNIPRIRKMIENLCDSVFGCDLKNGYIKYLPFPNSRDILMLSEYQLDSIKMGYRKKYVVESSKYVNSRIIDLSRVRRLNNTQEIIDNLKEFPGVGDKIANCVALFGYHRLDSFPIDVWIKKVIDLKYGGSLILSKDLYKYRGVVQQYIYYYSLNHKDEFKEEK